MLEQPTERALFDDMANEMITGMRLPENIAERVAERDRAAENAAGYRRALDALTEWINRSSTCDAARLPTTGSP